MLPILLEWIAGKLRATTAAGATWRGRRVWIEDGSSHSMRDLPALQDHFGRPSGQRVGCGFPVAKWLAMFDLATGLLLRVTISPLRTHDQSKACEVESEVKAGDVVLGDRVF